MTEQTRRYIESVTQKIVGKNKITDIDKIVSSIGGKIIEVHGIDIVTDGTVSKTGRNTFAIYIPQIQDVRRRNFIIAHELGHVILHMGFRTNKALWNTQPKGGLIRFSTYVQDYYATTFALSLLMPEAPYRTFVQQHSVDGRISARAIATHFNVTESVAIKRGQDLGIFA